MNIKQTIKAIRELKVEHPKWIVVAVNIAKGEIFMKLSHSDSILTQHTDYHAKYWDIRQTAKAKGRI